MSDLHLEEARQMADASSKVLEAARVKLAELQARHSEATADVADTEESLRKTAAGLADPADKKAAEAFHAASRRRAEMEARCEAFSATVIPAAVAALAQAETDHRETLRRLERIENQRLISDEVIPALKRFRVKAIELAKAGKDFEAVVDRVRGSLTGDGQQTLNSLIGPLTLLEAAPGDLQARFREAIGVVTPRDVEPILRSAFGLTES